MPLEIVVVLLWVSIAHAQFHVFPAGFQPSGVSNNASVVVGSLFDPSSNSFPAIWTPEAGIVPFGNPTPRGSFSELSSDGQRIIGTATKPNTHSDQMAIYDRGADAWTYFEAPGFIESLGLGISADGRTAVGTGWVDRVVTHAIQGDENGGFRDLGSTFPGLSSGAIDVDADGDVVVGWQETGAGVRQGAIWRDGVQSLLWIDPAQTLPAGPASSVSADGKWVAGSGAWPPNGEPYRWSVESGLQSLGNIHGSDFYVDEASAMSADAQVIVGSLGYFRTELPAAFLWTPELGMVQLQTHLRDLGIEMPPITSLWYAHDVSPDGRSIVGLGIFADGSGYLVTIPEPSSVSLAMAVGGIALLAMRCRRQVHAARRA